jgi:acyl-ACP thioesterase
VSGRLPQEVEERPYGLRQGRCLHLGVRSLCDYLQEAAGNHAHELGAGVDALRERGMAWVLLRIRVNITRLPGAGERVQVHTWHSGLDRLFSLRDFSLVDAAEDPSVTAVSAWVMSIFELGGPFALRLASHSGY